MHKTIDIKKLLLFIQREALESDTSQKRYIKVLLLEKYIVSNMKEVEDA